MTGQLELPAPTVGAVDYHPRTHQRHQSSIRAFNGFRVFTSVASHLLLKNIARMVQSHVKPKVIFWRCVDLLVCERIEVPDYTRLKKLILSAFKLRSHDLAAILEALKAYGAALNGGPDQPSVATWIGPYRANWRLRQASDTGITDALLRALRPLSHNSLIDP